MPRGRPKTPLKKALLQDFNEEDLGAVPDAPSHLNDDGILIWFRVWLSGKAHIENMDFFAVLSLAEAWQEKEYFRKLFQLKLCERTYATPQGQILTHPTYTQFQAAKKEVAQILASLGFTPSDRAKLGIYENNSENDPLIALVEEERKRRADMAKKKVGQDIYD